MSRNTEYQFVPTDTETIVASLVAIYEKLTGTTVQPASPERHFIQWVSNIIIQERVLNNYTGNQNIPSRAEGENLDAMGELFYASERPGAQPAVCTERFFISEAQNTAILIPAGTRVTDQSNTLIWETVSDAYVPVGATYIDVPLRCQVFGTAGNGYAIGQINTLVDIYDYYSECTNITTSDGGADQADDDEFYELLRASMDAYSTAGPIGGYIYHAKRVSTEIGDVVPNSPTPGVVYIYVLMSDGQPAGTEIKNAVLAACNKDEVRPFTDDVHMGDPETVFYNIDLTYYIPNDSSMSSADIESAVTEAVNEFVAWQAGKLGRDINPSKLYEQLMKTGIKRLELREPVFTVLRDGKLEQSRHYEYADTVPQVASIGTITVLNGGYEDE